jgi:tRNA threonylcarbamoyladenosine biosynthesis protein TsaB
LIVLGIDSSDDFIAVGIAGPDGIIISKASQAKGKNMLHKFLADILKEVEIDFQRIGAVAVTMGPGSFTGLRVGLAAAKGLCWSSNLPLAGVSSLQAIAFCSTLGNNKIAAVKDAKRNEFYYGGYLKEGKSLRQLIPDAVGPAERIADLLLDGFAVIGPGVPELKKYGVEGSGDSDNGYIQDAIGGAVALLGRDLILAGKYIELASASPEYIRTPKAKEWNP